MARVEYVKKAQQRYARVPVLNEDGSQKTITKTVRGKTVTVRLTAADKTKPLPLRKCEACRKEIAVGTPYKTVEPKFGGPRFRCGDCPTWQPWDLSDSVAANLQRIEHDLDEALSGDFEDASDAESALSDAAEAVRELAERRTEAADNIVDGFGHDTEMSDRLREHGDELESFADELEQTDLPDAPDDDDFGFDDEGNEVPEDERSEDDTERFNDEGTSYADALDAWRDEVREAATEAMQNAPYGDF